MDMISTLRRLVAACGLFALMAGPVIAADSPDAEDAARCEALAGGKFNNLPNAPTQIMSATHVPARNGMRAYCSIEGYVNPTIVIGLQMPAQGWNGKYITRGCGGSCGTVSMDRICVRHVRDGYACLHTDMGHRSGLADNNWAANNVQGQIDFGFRATHVATVAGKAITEAYYKKAPRKSYFFGCSTGGRQAMVEAQRFPDDFDGIIGVAVGQGQSRAGAAGDPKLTDPRFFNFDNGKPILPIRKVPMIHRAVLAKCDMNDGVKDGLIGDPRDCKFDPAELTCKGAESRNCLTPAQVEIARTIYAKRGMWPGSELNWINAFVRDVPPPVEQMNYTQSRGDPVVLPSLNNANNPDLRQFYDNGGKMIGVHGWSDPQIDPAGMIDYYDLASRTMGGKKVMDSFYRLFLVPGMDHCGGGEGAHGINYIGALDAWVDQGKAPDYLIGVHPKPGKLDLFGIDVPLLKPEDIVFTRAHYAYPQKPKFGKLDSGSKPQPQPIPNGSDSERTAALATRIAQAATDAEQFAIKSGFPRYNTISEISRDVLVTIDAADVPGKVSVAV